MSEERREREKKGREMRERDWRPDPHRLLPQSASAEMGLLSSMLIAPHEIIDDVRARVTPEVFAIPSHQLIFERMLAMHEGRQQLDFITLTQSLRDRQQLDQCGGAGFVTELFGYLPTAANYGHYVTVLLEKRTLRDTIVLCSEVASRAYEEQDQVNELVEKAVSGMLEIQAQRGTEDTVRPLVKFAAKAFEEIQYAYELRGEVVGTPTGFVDLDRMIGGWQRGMTYYVGARPAMGKTSLGLNFAAETGLEANAHGCPVLFFSIEMTGVQLAKRLICMRSEINLQRTRDGFMSKERDFEKLGKAVREVALMRTWVDETAALTILDFRARVRRWLKAMKRKYGERTDGKPEGLVVIDYLQRMKGSSKRADDARYLELQEIAQGISQTAKETGLPIVVLAQLKRPKDKKPETEPDMTEFRECGDIEQEAHVVALIHRPHYYVKHSEEKQQALALEMQERFRKYARFARRPDAEKITFTTEDLARYAKLIIDKQREGPVGPIDLRFIADYTRFETWDRQRELYSNNAEKRQRENIQEDEF